MRDSASLAGLMPVLFDAVRRAVRVAAVVVVESFDADSCSATVRLRVREERVVDGQRTPIEPLSISGCPVLFPGGAARGFTFGLDEGDECIALIRTQSHDEIDADKPAQSDGSYIPAGMRRLDLSDIVVLPGYVRPAAERDANSYKADGQPVVYMAEAEVLHVGDSTAAKALALAEKVDSQLGDIRTALNTLTLPVSGATAGPPAPLPFPTPVDSVECDDVKVRS